jgi:alkanesulfonate monooxygenase SsuD/methylene tetrahydromethanopterin reductase-like flavin-dependent oxidoreductase (luciferase family)
MRTVFTSRHAVTLARAREALMKQAAALAKSPLTRLREAANGDLSDWALIGEPAEVADGIARYRVQLGVTLLIARAQIPGVGASESEASLELLAEVGLSSL